MNTDESLKSAGAPGSAEEKEAKKMLTDFYTGYITACSSSLNHDSTTNFEHTLTVLQEKYCTKKLMNKLLKDFENGLDYDPFINAQDCDMEMLKTLAIKKDSQKINTWSVSYLYSSNDTTKIVIQLEVIKQDGQYKINGIL